MLIEETKDSPFPEVDVLVDREPFRHFAIPNYMSQAQASAVLSWFEADAPWVKHVEEGFYECFNMNLRSVEKPDSLNFLTDTAVLNPLRNWVGRAFSVSLKEKVDVAAHKLVGGQQMGIHTDFGPVAQTHRLLVQLNNGWSVKNGGILMMLDSAEPSEPTAKHRYYLPSNRTAIGFEISKDSHHAISPVMFGERYTLCFSFYQDCV